MLILDLPLILVYVILTLTTIYPNHATGLPREFAGPGQIFSGGPMPSLFLSYTQVSHPTRP